MTIEVDEDFLFALLDFSKFRGTSSDQTPPSMLIEEGPDLPEAPQLQASTEVYFEQLELQPIQLDLSFMRTESLNSDQAWVPSTNGSSVHLTDFYEPIPGFSTQTGMPLPTS